MKKGEKMDNARLGILDEKLENLATQSIQLSLSADLVIRKSSNMSTR